MKSKQKQLSQSLLDGILLRDFKTVKLLLAQGAYVNARDSEHNETALILAVKFADAAMSRLLLESGAEIEATDDKGKTALFFAPILSDKFELLISAGANIHARDKEGNSVLMDKISGSASLAEVEELLRLGADHSCQNENGENAYALAEQLGLLKIARRLNAGN